MLSITTWIALVATAILVRLVFKFYQNLNACVSSGLPYVCLPIYPHSILAQVTAPLWFPLLSLIPKPLRGNWFMFMNPKIIWDELYAPFRVMGSDTILLCSPTELLILTCSAEVISQVSQRRADFPKPVEPYSIIDIYGKSAISVEGALWKKHRKAITRPFNENNSRLVWMEGVYQAQKTLTDLFGNGVTSGCVKDVDAMTSQIALAVISKAGFGIRMNESGPHSDCDPDEGALDKRWVQGKTNGHRMSYPDAIFSVATDIFWLFIFPRPLLKLFPIASARRASKAYLEWGQYMREMVAAKRQELDYPADTKVHGADLLTNLVGSAHNAEDYTQDHTTNAKAASDGLSDDDIMGNAFLLIMAGYETTAGNLHVALLLLAMHVDSQRQLQRDIDKLFQGVSPSQWNYEQYFGNAMNGMPGAVLLETLRLMPPVIAIPKRAYSPQPIVVNGEKCTVPKGTTIAITVPAAHRNPNQWPHDKPRRSGYQEYASSNEDDDLGEFNPERWLQHSSHADQILQHATGTVSGLYQPPRGAYLPFSEGARACLGRRFSQVEIVAILSVIFQQYSVELEVEESDAEVDAMGESQRRESWQRARAEAQWKFRTKMKNLMTNRMTDASVAVRFVKRGGERFAAETW